MRMLEKGTRIMFGDRHDRSEYNIIGVFVVLKSFCIGEKIKEYWESIRDERYMRYLQYKTKDSMLCYSPNMDKEMWYSYDPHKFSRWLLDSGFIEQLTIETLNFYGDFSDDVDASGEYKYLEKSHVE